MSTAKTPDIVGYRAELMAELFLQELAPTFVARSPADLTYDFFAGFSNPMGGINTVGVEVIGTEQEIGETFQVERARYDVLANSNIPVLLLIVDVKRNRLFHVIAPLEKSPGTSIRVRMPVAEITDETKEAIRQKLSSGEISTKGLKDSLV